jgi:D-serine deaminase-like pyridoxal phosphate-dependent protein
MLPTTDEIAMPPTPVEEQTPAVPELEAPTPVPLPTPIEAHQRLETIFRGLPAPFAFIDLDALWANSADLLRRSRGKPIRIASEAIRSRPILERLLDLDPGFQGVLTHSLPETLWLWEHGVRDLVLANPTADRACLTRLARITSEDPDEAPVVMVDCTEHLDLIEEAATSFVAPVRVAIDIDLSWRPLGGLVKIGGQRSPIRTPEQAVALAQEIERRERIRLVGARAYESQISEIGDSQPGKVITNLLVRAMQSASSREAQERRGEIVAALSEVADLEFVNGGGTGSIDLAGGDWAVTEIAAGAGFYAPIRADHHRGFRLRPAAMFAMPVTRASEARTLEIAGAERSLPRPRDPLDVGDRVYFRDLRGGDLCERFNRLYLITGTTIRDEVPTYRGEGKAFA